MVAPHYLTTDPQRTGTVLPSLRVKYIPRMLFMMTRMLLMVTMVLVLVVRMMMVVMLIWVNI